MPQSIAVYPYCSSNARLFSLVMLLLGSVSLIPMVWFALQGAWPVIGFMGFEIVLALLLIQHHRRRQRGDADVITLTQGNLRIEHLRGQRLVRSWQMPKAWVRLQWQEGDGTRSPSLHACAKGERIGIGGFLSTPAKRDLYQTLQSYLAAAP